MSAPYPWLETPWRRLLASRARPAQALLIGGPAGVGKRALARAWAHALLCEAPVAGAACGECEACHWLAAGSHPDLRVVTLEEKELKGGEVRQARQIEVDQARDAVAFVQLSTHRAGHRVLIVDPADALNLAAANALLKVIEEPPPGTVFLLVADHPRQLLPTLRSRSQRIDVGLPPRAEAEAWLAAAGVGDAATRLALAGGAPLAAQAAAAGVDADRAAVLAALARPEQLAPVAQADGWKDIPPAAWHAIVYKWLADLLGASQGVAARFNPDFSDALVKLGPRVAVSGLLRLSRVQAQEGRHLDHPLNRALQLEAWLVQYRNLFVRKAAR